MYVRCSLLLAQPSPDLDAEAPKEPAVALPGCRAVTKNETLEDFAIHCLTRKVQLPRLLPPRLSFENRGFEDLHAAPFRESRMVVVSWAK